jgi:hypothetical protein
MVTTVNASTSTGLVSTADTSGIIKVQSNGKTTNALAWVNFNGPAATINAQYNVSSITRTGTGQWTVNFTTALTDANYAANVTTTGGFTGSTSSFSTSTVSIISFYSGSYYDSSIISVAVFGN